MSEQVVLNTSFIMGFLEGIGSVAFGLFLMFLDYLPHLMEGYAVMAKSISSSMGREELTTPMSYFLLMLSAILMWEFIGKLSKGAGRILYVIGGVVVLSVAIYLLL